MALVATLVEAHPMALEVVEENQSSPPAMVFLLGIKLVSALVVMEVTENLIEDIVVALLEAVEVLAKAMVIRHMMDMADLSVQVGMEDMAGEINNMEALIVGMVAHTMAQAVQVSPVGLVHNAVLGIMETSIIKINIKLNSFLHGILPKIYYLVV